jgi:alpha-L-fucosidase 2
VGASAVIRLLPALPAAWASGEVKGLRARGAVTVDIVWENGKLRRAMLHPDRAGEIEVRYKGATKHVLGQVGHAKEIDLVDFTRP